MSTEFSKSMFAGELEPMRISSILIILSFLFVVVLESQSAASYASYVLAILVIFRASRWVELLKIDLFWAISTLIFYLVLSSAWSTGVDARSAVSVFVRGLLVVTFVISLAECQLRGEVQVWLGRSLAIVGAVAAAASIWYFYQDPPTNSRLNGLGQLDNPVVAGLIFAVVLLFCIERILNENRLWLRNVLLLAALALIFALTLTRSINAWFSAVAGVSVLVVSHLIADRMRFLAVLASSSVLCAAALVTVLSTSQGFELVLPRGDSFRLEIWSKHLNSVLQEGIIFGKGILTPDSIWLAQREIEHPHNMFLSVLVQGGLVGLLLFCVLIWKVFSVLLASYALPQAKLALSVVVVAMLSYLLDGHELIDKVGETWFLFWYPVGIALGIALSGLAKPRGNIE